MSWAEYWTHMASDGIWVNHLFIQVTAWYLGLDIKILTTSATPGNNFIFISGNIDKVEEPGPGPPLIIGNYTNIHYQSLLPINLVNSIVEKQLPKCDTTKNVDVNNASKNHSQKDDFVYIHNNESIVFPNHENGKLMCPFCKTASSDLQGTSLVRNAR